MKRVINEIQNEVEESEKSEEVPEPHIDINLRAVDSHVELDTSLLPNTEGDVDEESTDNLVAADDECTLDYPENDTLRSLSMKSTIIIENSKNVIVDIYSH